MHHKLRSLPGLMLALLLMAVVLLATLPQAYAADSGCEGHGTQATPAAGPVTHGHAAQARALAHAAEPDEPVDQHPCCLGQDHDMQPGPCACSGACASACTGAGLAVLAHPQALALHPHAQAAREERLRPGRSVAPETPPPIA